MGIEREVARGRGVGFIAAGIPLILDVVTIGLLRRKGKSSRDLREKDRHHGLKKNTHRKLAGTWG